MASFPHIPTYFVRIPYGGKLMIPNKLKLCPSLHYSALDEVVYLDYTGTCEHSGCRMSFLDTL